MERGTKRKRQRERERSEGTESKQERGEREGVREEGLALEKS